MKSLKLIALFGVLGGLANAATITVSQGVGAQGYTVLVNSVAPANFYWAAGNYNTITSTFTQFGASVLDTLKVNGSVSASSPSSLNSSIVHIFVGTGSNIANSSAPTGSWVIMQSTNAATLFPPDVAAATGVTFGASVTNAVTFIAKSNESNGFTAPVGAVGGSLNLVSIPEPSAALLGALGALGLLRRRRN